jgi:hypothetical protein
VSNSFDVLLAEALAAPFTGWDFRWLRGRSDVEPLPWDYRAEIAERAGHADRMLDMGTGGGEVLAGLQVRARLTAATEAWPPNVPVAQSRLRPRGIHLVHPTTPGKPASAGGCPFAAGSSTS